MEKENKIINSNDDMTQKSCQCDDLTEIKYVPNEYFYNSCDCAACDCENHTKNDDMLCSCGYMNPLGYDYSEYSCKCEYMY
ncbi:MAG: hypothetical protein K6C94_04570 [Candidatus Gastranaerophilales bacterium]|nr:hypothetical protein [Candidatus Gastranaerophilales bacterium]